VQKQISEAPTPAHVHREDLPDWCASMLDRALAKSPGERFQTAEEFRDALRKATGMVTTELSKAFAISIEAAETTASSQPAGLDHFGPIPVQAAAPPTLVLADPGPSGSTGRAPLNAEIRIVLPKRRQTWLGGSLLAILGAGIVLLATATPWRPEVDPGASISSLGRARAAAAGTSLDVSVEFNARTLVREGSQQRETRSRVALAERSISVKADGTHRLLHEVPYDQVRSISSSHGIDPLWTGPNGPRRVVRATGGMLGILGISIARDWVSLRTTNAAAEFIVLRFDNDAQARRVVAALEKRTGRTAERVGGQP
jgi:hypothetical protein